MLEDMEVDEGVPGLDRRAARRGLPYLNLLVRLDCGDAKVDAGVAAACELRLVESTEIAGALERWRDELISPGADSIRMQVVFGEVGDERAVLLDAFAAFEKLRAGAGRYKSDSSDQARDDLERAAAAAVSDGIDAAVDGRVAVVPISHRTDPNRDRGRALRGGTVIAAPRNGGGCRLVVGIDDDLLEIQLRFRSFTRLVHRLKLDVSQPLKNWLWGVQYAIRDTERAVLHEASALTVELARKQRTDVREILSRISEYSMQVEQWQVQLDVVDATFKDAAADRGRNRGPGFIWRQIALSEPDDGLPGVMQRVAQLDAQVKRLLTIVTTATMAEQLRDSAERSEATNRVQRFALILAVLFTGPTLVATVLGAGVSGLHPGIALYTLLLISSTVVCLLLLWAVGWPRRS